MTLLARVSRALESHGVAHAVIGATALAVHGVSAAPADLVLLKLYAGGPQDAWDIAQLLDAAPAIEPLVEASLGGLPAECAALWRRIRARRA